MGVKSKFFKTDFAVGHTSNYPGYYPIILYHQYTHMAFNIEASAERTMATWNGEKINHQWCKSQEYQDLNNKKNIVLKAVKSDGYALEYVESDIDSYKEIVLAAMEQNLDAAKFSKLTPLETKLLFKKITAEKLLPIKSLVEGISTMIEKYTGEQGELTLTHSIASYIQPFLTVKNASLMTQLNRQLSELTKAYPNGLK